MNTTNLPAFESASSVELNSIADSKIDAVSLYSSRAEVTRLYKFAVKTGLNQVNISGLPDVLEAQSLRVEGRGTATIQVTVSSAKRPKTLATSEELTALLKKREEISNAFKRCENSLASLEKYLDSMTVEHLDGSKLAAVMENYDTNGGKLEKKRSELTEQLLAIDNKIQTERSRLAGPREHDKLRMKAEIGVFAEAAGDVEIALIYAVPRADWTAFYDVRVDTTTKEDPITLIYKAAVKQNTGESWDEVPLTLETSIPTFGLDIPQLAPWNMEVRRHVPPPSSYSKSRAAPLIVSGSVPHMEYSRKSRSHSPQYAKAASTVSSSEAEEMEHGAADVTSEGNFSATFRMPGLVTIPSDGEVYNFTIVQVKLKAKMSWVSVPKVDTTAHINARIINDSEFTFIRGTASVYVDGSFFSRSDIPSVSPKESFDCPLGVDAAIRITYHPVIKKKSQLGFYNKRAHCVFKQRITLFNTKSVAIERLKVVDQIPASRDEQIEVKLVNPALTLPSNDNNASKNNGTMNTVSLGFGSKLKRPKQKSGAAATPQKVNVAHGVIAQWDGTDEPDCEVEALGLDRKLNWVCKVPAHTKVNLALEWEVTVSPARAQIFGL